MCIVLHMLLSSSSSCYIILRNTFFSVDIQAFPLTPFMFLNVWYILAHRTSDSGYELNIMGVV